jgi:hypothetical protein
MTSEDLVRTYITIRNAKDDLVAAHKAKLAELQADQDAITTQLLEICKAEGQNGFQTDAGTVTRRVQSRFWASDWETMYEYINKHQAPYLLEQRIHNTHMTEFLEDNDPPQGLQQDSKYVITVRKPPAK